MERDKVVRRISKQKHRQYCCIHSGLNCCCGIGTKWEQAFGKMTEKQAENLTKEEE